MARSFEKDEPKVTEQISPKEFEKLFSNFGYNQALSKDDSSLSYVTQPFKNLRFLMIDSNIYTHEKSTVAPITNGVLKTQTLQWISAQLEQAKKDHIIIVPIIQHNVLSHHDMLNKGYALYSQSIYSVELGDALTNIISPLNEHFFSGELLTQNYLDKNVYNQPTYQTLLDYNNQSFLIRYINRSIDARLNRSMRHIIVPMN